MTKNHPHPEIRYAHELIEDISEDVNADLLQCDRCGHEMVVRSSQVSDEPCKHDIRIKCPTTTEERVADIIDVDVSGCGWWTRHGIPISKTEYETRLKNRDHRMVDSVSTEWPEEEEPDDVRERLNALGYLDS